MHVNYQVTRQVRKETGVSNTNSITGYMTPVNPLSAGCVNTVVTAE